MKHNPSQGDAATLARAALPAQPISQEVLLEKYAKGDERSIAAVHARVARALAAIEADEQRGPWEERFAAALDAGATGVLHNATLAADLSSAVDAVLAGQRYCPPPGAR